MAVVDSTTANVAWAEYLSSTRNLIGFRYERVEPFAWAELQSKLGTLKVARKVDKCLVKPAQR